MSCTVPAVPTQGAIPEEGRNLKKIVSFLFIGACDSQNYAYQISFPGGASGTLNLTFTTDVPSWQVAVEFDTPTYKIDSYIGANANCPWQSSTCSFTNSSWNGAHKKGESLAAGFTIYFSSLITGNNTSVVSITLNGQLICAASNPTVPTGSPSIGAQII